MLLVVCSLAGLLMMPGGALLASLPSMHAQIDPFAIPGAASTQSGTSHPGAPRNESPHDMPQRRTDLTAPSRDSTASARDPREGPDVGGPAVPAGSKSPSPLIPTVTPATSAEYGYDEETIGLPGFDPLSGDLRNLNGLNEQIPTLSSDFGQPVGIYYVDNSSDFDELNLTSGLVRTVAPVVLLYQEWGYNAMLDDEFSIPYGYDVALFFGTTALGRTTYSIELVNLTTGVKEIWNTSAAVSSVNQQPIYVGNDTVVVASSNYSLIAYNLYARTEWTAGSLEFFEANNLYWIPQRQQLIDVQADGSANGRVEQLSASYDLDGEVHFTGVATVTVDSSVTFNFVNGIDYNASSDEIAFSAGIFSKSAVFTYVLPFASDGLLTTVGEQKHPVYQGKTETYPTLVLGQQYVYTSNYTLGADLDSQQYLYDAWNNSTLLTNRSFVNAPCPNSCFESTFAPSVDYLIDLNASLALGSPLYRVVYAYHNATQPFPSSGSVPFPPVPPAPTGVAVRSTGFYSLTVNWTESPGSLVENNTVYVLPGSYCTGTVGSGGAIAEFVASSDGSTTPIVVGGLSNNTTYSVYVTSWGVAGQGPPSECVRATTLPVISPGLAVLLNVYADRPDLDLAFPGASEGNLTSLTQLVDWAANVVDGSFADSAFDQLAASDIGYYYELMGVYNNRPDLQSAYPDAYTDERSYSGLLSWAGEVVTGQFTDSSNSTLKPWGYAYDLFWVYNGRTDLKAGFPGASANLGAYLTLVNWAGGVVTGSFTDSDRSNLTSFGYYYALMWVYDGRSDLRTAFPDAYGNWTNFSLLVNWAGNVVNDSFPDIAESTLAPFGYYYALMVTYDGRSDLQAAFPLAYVNAGSYAALLSWAKDVVLQDFPDSAYTTLLPFASQYEALG